MGTQNQKIEINAIVKTSLENVDKTIKELSGKLKDGNLQIDLTKGVGKDLSKLVSNFESSMSKINQMTPDNELAIGDSKEFQKEGQAIIKTIKEIQRITGDLGTKNLIDAKKLFPNSFDSRVDELQNSINNADKAFAQLANKKAAFNKLNIEIVGIQGQIAELDAAAKNVDGLKALSDQATVELQKVENEVESLRQSLLEEIKIKFAPEKIKAAEEGKAISEKEISHLSDQGVSAGAGGKGVFQGKGIGDWQKIAKTGSEEEKQRANQAIELLKRYNKITAELREQNKLLEDNKKIQEALESSPDLSDSKSMKTVAKVTGKKEKTDKILKQQTQATEKATIAQENFNSAQNASAGKAELEKDLKKKTQALQALEAVIKGLESGTDLQGLAQKFKEITNLDMPATPEGLQQMLEKLKEIDEVSYKNLKSELNKLEIVLPETKKEVENLGDGFTEAKEDVNDFNRSAEEIKNLKNSMMDFFGIQNSIDLFKQGVSSAIDTIRELDKTMTEAAVVTEFSVGDMWDKLPEYTKAAQELGVSINGMYGATTLYYQQGLKTNEAMALGVETMKMAKIAGMDATDSTKAMTAALRGFNMELNETSAIRVNDVYSQLAAVTAADTAQISTAMEKTASIAASANMEFETTAALLSQIIETTQEAPETAGTAMKTIIARFAEVKKLSNEGQTVGMDSEGESLDVNKIQTALRTVGISMDGFFEGTEGLDSVLLKLAEKWNTLDFETQRYIATTAAGSRQQSRFIAMMSDYARTTELVGEAQNSAGASQRQFEKTQDSMEAKIQKLANAWDQFLMGLSNNEILKFGVDLLTSVLEVINKMTDSLSGGNGLIKSVISLITVISGLKLGKSALSGVFGLLGFGGKKGEGKGATPGTQPTATTPDGKNPTQQALGNTQQQGQTEGYRAGQGFASGVQRGIEQAKGQTTGKVKGFFKGLFTRQLTEEEKAMRDKHLTQKAERKAGQQLKGSFLRQGGDQKVAYLNKLFKSTDKNNPALNPSFNDEQIAQVERAYQKTADATGDMGKAMDAANAETLKLGGTLMDQKQQQQLVAQQSKQTAIDFSAIGQAAMGAGMAIGLLGQLFDSMGLDGAAKACEYLSAGLMGVGMVLMVLMPIIEMIKKKGYETQIAWWWLVLIIAILALVVAAIVLIAQAWSEASEEAQLEEMKEELNDLKEAADEAKEKLEEMAAQREELDKLGEAFKGLTKNSREWKEALIENNQKVLELLGTYPELAGYIDKGVHGEMTISDEGWDVIMDEQQQAHATAIAAKSAKESQIARKQQYIDTEKIMAEAVGSGAAKDYADFMATDAAKWLRGGVGYALSGPMGPLGALLGSLASGSSPEEIEREQTGGLTYDEFNDFASLAAERGLSLSARDDEDDFRKAYLDMGYSEEDFDKVWSSMNKMGTEFDKLAQTAHATSIAERARIETLLDTLSASSGIVNNSEYGDTAKKATAQSFEDYDERVAEVSAQYEEDLDVKDLDSDEAEILAQRYADANNMTLDEVRKKVEDDELSIQTMADFLAAEDINDEMLGALEKTTQILERILNNMPKEKKSAIQGMLKDGGLGLSETDLEQLESIEDADQMADFLKGSGFTDQDAIALGYENFDAFATAMLANTNTARDASEEVYKAYNTSGFGEKLQVSIGGLNDQIKELGITSGLSIGETKALAQSLGEVMANGGNADAVLSKFPRLLSGLSGAELESGINLLTSTDWTSQESIKETINALRELGVTLDNDMIYELYDLSNALSDFSIESIEGELEKLQELMDSVTAKIEEGSKKFTKEERDQLIEQGFGQNQFVRTGINEYVFMGETNALLKNIEDYTSKILNEVREDLGDQIDTGKGYQNVIDNFDGNGSTKTTTHRVVNLDYDGDSELIKDLNKETEALLKRVIKQDGSIDIDQVDDESKAILAELSGVNLWNIFDLYSEEEAKNIMEQLTSGKLDSDDFFKASIEKALLDKYVVTDEGSFTYKDEENNDRAASATEIYNKILSGELDWWGYDSPKKGGLTRETMESIMRNAGTWIDGEHDNYSDAQLYAALKEDLEQWRALPQNTADYIRTTTEQSTIEYYNKVGTKEFTDDYYDGSESEKREIWDENVGNMMFGDESAQDLAKRVAYGETSDADYGFINQLATALDSSLEGADIATQQEAIAEYYQDLFLMDEAMDAYITSEAGLETAVEHATDQLEAQGSEMADDTARIRNLVAATNKADKGMDKLNEVISDQAEAFAIGDKNSQQYRQALEKVTAAAKEAFGENINEDFVHEHRDLFNQLAQGGEVAQQAYEQIGKELATDYIEGLGRGEEATNALQAAMNNIPKNLAIGATFDATQAMQALMDLNYTAEQAAEILESMNYTVEYETEVIEGKTYIKSAAATKRGAGGTGVNAPSSSGGSSSKWENPYDEFYNTVAKINEELRKREKLELRYQRLLDRNAATAKELADLTDKQLESYKTERLDRTFLLRGREAQMDSILEQYSDVGKYATYNKEAGQVEIDWAALEALEGSTDEELTSRIEDYISKLEEQEGLIEEEQDALDEIEDAVWEIYDQGKDEYFGLEDRIKEAIITDRQKEIDKLSEINESINDTNSKILDSMQQQIDEYRQNRDNEKTEKEIEDKQRRLSYLQQDTSGANALEIQQLQKEIDESQESYTDQLIDQKISELQKQNDQAAEQRQQQIDIMQAQLDHYSESAEIWNDVQSLIKQSVSIEGDLMPGSKLVDLLKSTDGFDGMSQLKKMNWMSELETSMATALAWLESGAMQSLYGMGASVTFTDAEGTERTGIINKDGDVLVEDKDGKQAYSAGSFKIDPKNGKITSSETAAQAADNYETASKVTSNTPNVTNVYNSYGNGGGGSFVPVDLDDDDDDDDDDESSQARTLPSYVSGLKVSKDTLSQKDYVFRMGAGVPVKTDADGDTYVQTTFSSRWIKTKDVNTDNSEVIGAAGGMTAYKMIGPFKTYALDTFADGAWITRHLTTGEKINYQAATRFKTGGLADFTGPAWLDGTKSKPEYILNADQTKAFFNLVDVLGSLQLKPAQNAQNSGDSIYDIDINVESIGNDYDVEQLATTVKRLINEDARYRNNNAINLMR